MKSSVKTALQFGLIALALLLLSSAAHALDIFWTNESAGTIQASDADGSNLTTLVSGLLTPRSIQYYNNSLYFSENGSLSSIKRVDLNANRTGITGVTTLFSSGNVLGATGIAIDSVNSEIYYTRNTWAEEIWKANLDGTGSPSLVLSDSNNPRGIALDVAANAMYWLRSNTSEAVLTATLSGGSPTVLLPTGGSPQNIALDIPNSHIYYTNNGGGGGVQGIYRLNFDGTGSIQLSATDGITGIALDLVTNKMYLTNRVTEEILVANLDASGMTTLNTLAASSSPYDITVVPEPSTYALVFGLGILLFAGVRRCYAKRRSKSIA